jgi:hypothetical protein
LRRPGLGSSGPASVARFAAVTGLAAIAALALRAACTLVLAATTVFSSLTILALHQRTASSAVRKENTSKHDKGGQK